MATIARPQPPLTAADLPAFIARLGGVAPERVRLEPPPGRATEADLIRAREHKLGRCELVHFTLVEKPTMGTQEVGIASVLVIFMGHYAITGRHGMVLGDQALIRTLTGTVRSPDGIFVSSETWDRFFRSPTPVVDFAPDIAIEVLSKTNTRAEMARKRREYFALGTRLVWEIHPRRRTVNVYTDPATYTRLTASDALDGGAVLPGFSIPLARLFGNPLDAGA